MNILGLLAQSSSNCTVNGEAVPCDEVAEQVGNFIAGGFIILIILGVIGVLLTIFWIAMLIHAARHDIKDKALWIVILLLTGALGAVIYYFVVKRNFQKIPTDSSPLSQPQASDNQTVQPQQPQAPSENQAQQEPDNTEGQQTQNKQ